MAVHGAISERVDHPGLAEHRLTCRLLEGQVVDQRREVVLVRQFERGVMLVGPAHRQFERAPRLEAGRARVGVHHCFCFDSSVKHRRPFALQERELAHARASNSADSCSTYTPITEDPPTLPVRDLADDADALQVGERLVDRGRREPGSLDQCRRGSDGLALQGLMHRERRGRRAPQTGDTVAIRS